MKRCTLLFLLSVFIFTCSRLFSIDYRQWIIKSTRDSNDLIFQILLKTDKDTQINILKALGQRQDLYQEDIILSLMTLKDPLHDTELYLDIILQSVLNSPYKDEKVELWTRVNPLAFTSLIKSLPVFKNFYLKTAIIQLLPYAANHVDIKSYLMSETQKIINEVKNQTGNVTFGQKKELMEILEAIGSFNDKDFLELCISLVEACNDRELVKKAHIVIKELLS